MCFEHPPPFNYMVILYLPGPHIGYEHAWPMSLLLQAMTTDDDEEIKESLNLVLLASKLGLIHESKFIILSERQLNRNWATLTGVSLGINVNRISDYTSKSAQLPGTRIKLTGDRKLVCM